MSVWSPSYPSPGTLLRVQFYMPSCIGMLLEVLDEEPCGFEAKILWNDGTVNEVWLDNSVWEEVQ